MIISLIVFGIEHFIFYTMNLKQISDITPGIKPSIKLGMKQGIKPDVKKSIKINKKNKILLKDKAPPKNNVILVLPEASNLFQQVLMSKRYQNR